MSDKTLREKLIRLAHAKPELRGDLLPLLREDEGLDKTARGSMMSINMAKVVKELGGSAFKAKSRKEVTFYKYGWGSGDITVTDNGGEVNISHTVSLTSSVPFWSTFHPGGIVGPKTLAYRMEQAVKGSRIDYELDLDKK